MTRLKDNYESSRYRKFKRWFDGDVNLLEGITEATIPNGSAQESAHGAGASASASDAGAGVNTDAVVSSDAGVKADEGVNTNAGVNAGAGVDTVIASGHNGGVSDLEARRRASEEVYGPEVWPQRETIDYVQWRKHAQEALDARIHPLGDVTGSSDGFGDSAAGDSAASGRIGTGGSGGAVVRGLKIFQHFYVVMSVVLCALIIGVFLWTTIHLPPFGSADNPANNEVPTRYIESGVAETGAVNFVTGMILDYRAFDTFGESCVLFIASCCVLVLLRIDASNGKSRARSRGPQEDDRLFEPKNDVILQRAAFILVPLILVFGVYIVLNGHLSPGGGFSGGAVLGSGLILYLNAFGFAKTERFFTEKVYRRVTLCALTFYCLAKSYSFFTGANHLESGIPLGTPGAILSSGLILPLNICVGLVVMCTMYAFYTLFRKGGM